MLGMSGKKLRRIAALAVASALLFTVLDGDVSSDLSAYADEPHIHTYTYAAGVNEASNTITATCTCEDIATCGGANVTITLSAPASLTYNKTAKSATVGDYPETRPDGLAACPDITYYNSTGAGSVTPDGEALGGAPCNVGNYVAEITWVGEVARVAFSIGKKQVGLEWTNTSFTYDGDTKCPTAAATGLEDGDTCTVTVTGGAFAAGSHTATATELGNSNYCLPDAVTQSFTIAKADQTAPAAPTKNTATISSVTLDTIENGQYKIEGGEWQDEATFNGLDMNTAYTFYQRIAEDENHNASGSSTGASLSTNDHVHEWGGYTVSGATITATCADSDTGHGVDKTASITLVAPTLAVYGGTGDAAATITGSIAGISPTIVYKSGETVLDAAPTTAGTYTANITLGSATASVEYTIEQKEVGLTWTNDSLTYNESVQLPTATATGLEDGDTCNVTVTGGQTDVGNYTATATELDNDNYKLPSEVTHAFSITKATWATPAAPTAASVSVDSITLVAPAGYEFKKGSGSWQESPTFSGLSMATEYSFYQRVKGDSNHNASESSPAATISTNSHVHEWVDFSVSGSSITATCTNLDGYHGTPLTASITLVAPTRTVYGGSGDAEATILGSIAGIPNPSIVYKSGSTTLGAPPTDVGTYTASITLNDVTATLEYSIAKAAAISLSASQKPTGNTGLAYTGSAQALATAPSSALPGGYTMKYALTTEDAEPGDDAFATDIPTAVDAGTYYVWYKAVDSSSYEDTAVTKLTVTVNKMAAPTPGAGETPAAAENLVYTGSAQALVTDPTSLPSGYTAVQYRLSDTEEWNATIPTGTAKADYTVQVHYVGDSNHADFNGANISVSIAAKDLSTGAEVTYSVSSLVYEGNPLAPVITVTIASSNTTLTADTDYDVEFIGVSPTTYAQSSTAPTDPGEYKAVVTFKGNYTGSVTAASSFAITRSSEAPTPSNDSIVYDGSTYDVSNLFSFPYVSERTYTIITGESNGTGTLSGNTLTITKAGTITIKVETAETAVNTASEATAVLTVSRGSVTGSLTIANITYGGTLTPSVSVTPSTANQGTIQYKLASSETWSATVPTAAGDYQARVTLGDDDLYDALVQTDDFTIAKKALAVTADNKTKVRDQDDPALTYTVTGLVEGDTASTVFTGALTREEGEDVGSYSITRGTLAVSDANYDLADSAFTAGTFSITRAIHADVTAPGEISVPSVATSNLTVNVWNLISPAPAAGTTFAVAGKSGVVSGNPTVSGSTVTYAVAGGSVDDPGSITVTVSDPNYESYTLTIALKTADIGYIGVTALSGASSPVTSVSADGLDTLAQQQNTTPGEAVAIKLDVVKKAGGDVDASDLTSITGVTDGLFVNFQDSEITKAYLEIDVRKYTGTSIDSIDTSGAGTVIPVTASPIEIALTVGTSVTSKNPVAVRVHDGNAVLLNRLTTRPQSPYPDSSYYIDSTAGIIYIYSKDFSVYSLYYANSVPCTVTFDTAGGSSVATRYVKSGEALTNPGSPSKAGYNFAGWLSGGSAYDFTAPVTTDLTLTASWTAIPSSGSSGSSDSGNDDEDEEDSSDNDTSSSNTQASAAAQPATSGKTGSSGNKRGGSSSTASTPASTTPTTPATSTTPATPATTTPSTGTAEAGESSEQQSSNTAAATAEVKAEEKRADDLKLITVAPVKETGRKGFGGLVEYLTNEDCHMHWPIAMVALHGIIFTIVFRKKKVALVVSLIADSVIMVVLSLLGECAVDYVVSGAGFAIMAVITAVSLAGSGSHTAKDDDFIETIY